MIEKSARSDSRWALYCFAVTFLIYIAFIPHFLTYSSPPTGDQPFYLMDVASLAQDHDLDVRNNYDQFDFDKFYALAPHPPDFAGMSAPYPIGRQLALSTARPDAEQYSFHPPGLPVLLTPFWIIGGLFQVWWPGTVIGMALIGALTATNIFLLAYEVGGRRWVAGLVWLALAFSSPLMTYSYLIFTELPAGLLLIYAFRRLSLGWAANGPARRLLIGFCIGYIPWLSWRCAPIAVGLALYAAYTWWRAAGSGQRAAGSDERAAGSGQRAAGQIEDQGLAIEGRIEDGAGIEAQIERRETEAEGQIAGRPLRGPHRNEQLANSGTPAADPIEKPVSQTATPVAAQPATSGPRPSALVARLASAAWLGGPLAGLVLLIPIYSLILFGQLLPSSHLRDEPIEPVFYWPWAGLQQLTLFTTGFFGQLFDQTFGLLTFAPVYILAAVGAIALGLDRRPEMRRLGLWLAVLVLPYGLMMAAFQNWTGAWCPPARYLTTLVPLLAAPLAASLAALAGTWMGWLYGLVYTILALPGLGLMAVRLQDARIFWPSSNTIVFDFLYLSPESPFFQKIDFRPFLPSFILPDEVRQPTNSGWIIAAATGIVLLGYGLLLFRRRQQRAPAGVSGSRWAPALHGVAWVGALAALGGGWYTVNYEYLQHKTILTEERRWMIERDPPLPDVRGIAYLGGKVYIAVYGERQPDGSTAPGQVGVIDVQAADGTYAVVQPSNKTSALAWSNPGDIQVGPDGLLYVLNNGPKEQALLVIQPDGRVVRQVNLDQTTTAAKGLHVSADGTLYVADTVGGSIYKFGKDGGVPAARITGRDPQLNNPAGVYANAAGAIFTTETYERVQQLDPKGHFVRLFDVTCRPSYFAAPAPAAAWLDLSCDKGIRSLNTQTGAMQQARVAEGNPPLNLPTGLTYDPDGHLYIFDQNSLIEYSVAH